MCPCVLYFQEKLAHLTIQMLIPEGTTYSLDCHYVKITLPEEFIC